MKLTLTKADQAKAGNYLDNRNCLIATALKRRFPKSKNISVGGCDLTLGRTRYHFHPYAIIPKLAKTPSMLPFTIELTKRKSMARC